MLEELQNRIRSCNHCKLREKCRFPVPPEGNPLKGLWFLGEAPGENEDKLGRPFIGRAGKILRSILYRLGIEDNTSILKNSYLTNVLKCRPPNNRFNRGFANVCMKQHLTYELDVYKPRVVIVLGKNATLSVLSINLSFDDMIGKTFRYWHNPDILWCVTYHPAYYLYTHDERIAKRLYRHIKYFYNIYRRCPDNDKARYDE